MKQSKTELVEVQIGNAKLDCKVTIPQFRAATREQPEEGGINNLEITNIYFKGFDVFDLLNEIDGIYELIFDKCKNKLK